MNITIVRESLYEILQKAGYFISNRISDLKVFKSVLITARQNGIVINTTNVNEYFSGEIGGKVFKTGEALVDFKTLFEIVKNLPDTKVTIEKKNNELSIVGKSGKIKLLCLDSSNFPGFDPVGKNTPLDKDLFKSEAVEPALLSCATDEARPILTGLCFDFREKETRIIGTDGFRMSLFRHGATNKSLVGQKLVLSGRSLASVLKVFKNTLSKVEYLETEKKIIFQGGGATISTKLLEGEFPPYERVIPQSNDTRVVLKRGELLEIVRSSSLFAKEGSNMLNLAIDNNDLTVSSSGVGVGEAVFTAPLTDFSGKQNRIVFNYRYLLEFLSSFSEEEVVFEMTNPFAPGVFKAKKNPKHLHIIMPIRSQE